MGDDRAEKRKPEREGDEQGRDDWPVRPLTVVVIVVVAVVLALVGRLWFGYFIFSQGTFQTRRSEAEARGQGLNNIMGGPDAADRDSADVSDAAGRGHER